MVQLHFEIPDHDTPEMQVAFEKEYRAIQDFLEEHGKMALCTFGDNGEIQMILLSALKEFWFDKNVYDYLQSIPEADRENMKKLARLNSLKGEVAALEDEISKNNT